MESQRITETLETNYMPYAMSVIMSRAIPEIDGFKPSHRKLLYTTVSYTHLDVYKRQAKLRWSRYAKRLGRLLLSFCLSGAAVPLLFGPGQG